MCVLLMVNLGSSTWVVFVLWMAVGSAVYLGYGRRHSTVAALTDEEYARASAEALPAPGTSETSVTPEILETTK
jgi:APA family basic amino acid/polyamine antiporter